MQHVPGRAPGRCKNHYARCQTSSDVFTPNKFLQTEVSFHARRGLADLGPGCLTRTQPRPQAGLAAGGLHPPPGPARRVWRAARGALPRAGSLSRSQGPWGQGAPARSFGRAAAARADRRHRSHAGGPRRLGRARPLLPVGPGPSPRHPARFPPPPPPRGASSLFEPETEMRFVAPGRNGNKTRAGPGRTALTRRRCHRRRRPTAPAPSGAATHPAPAAALAAPPAPAAAALALRRPSRARDWAARPSAGPGGEGARHRPRPAPGRELQLPAAPALRAGSVAPAAAGRFPSPGSVSPASGGVGGCRALCVLPLP